MPEDFFLRSSGSHGPTVRLDLFEQPCWGALQVCTGFKTVDQASRKEDRKTFAAVIWDTPNSDNRGEAALGRFGLRPIGLSFGQMPTAEGLNFWNCRSGVPDLELHQAMEF